MHEKYLLAFVLMLIVTIVFSLSSVAFADGNTTLKINLTDVGPDSWALGYVNYVISNGIFTGTSVENAGGFMNVTFSPDDYMTKEQLALILARLQLSEIPDYNGTSAFSDVDDDAWYADGVIWAEREGITKGKGDGTFGVGDSVTRQEFATMLSRYIERFNVKTASFTGTPTELFDKDDIASWATDGVDMLRTKRILLGNDKNMFFPENYITRAEATSLIVRFCSLCPDAIARRLPDVSEIGHLVIRGEEFPHSSEDLIVDDPEEIKKLIGYLSEAEFTSVTEDYLRMGPTAGIALYGKDGKFVKWLLNYDSSTISFTVDGMKVYHYNVTKDYMKPFLDATVK